MFRFCYLSVFRRENNIFSVPNIGRYFLHGKIRGRADIVSTFQQHKKYSVWHTKSVFFKNSYCQMNGSHMESIDQKKQKNHYLKRYF